MAPEQAPTQPMTIAGRYVLGPRIASGGMATVYVGQVLGAVGFTRVVAIKRLHQQYAREPDFVSMMIDEARLAAMIRHPNVVPTLDVVADGEELFVVMEYVEGASLSRVLYLAQKKNVATPPDVGIRVASDLLYGLDAAHEAVDENGHPLGVVHRDVSPQNVMVGIDGVSRVIDFGIAKAAGRVQVTREGQIKGKLAFMAPEQLLGKPLDRRADIYGAAVVLWELLTGERLFFGQNEGQLVASVIRGIDRPPSSVQPSLSPKIDEVVMRGLAVNADKRYSTAREFALAIEDALGPAKSRGVADWLKSVAQSELTARRDALRGGTVTTSQPSALAAVSAIAATGSGGAASGARPADKPLPPPPPPIMETAATEIASQPDSTSNSLQMTKEAVFNVLSGQGNEGSGSRARPATKVSERPPASAPTPKADVKAAPAAPPSVPRPSPSQADLAQSLIRRNIHLIVLGIVVVLAIFAFLRILR